MNVFSVKRGTFLRTPQQIGLLCITAYYGMSMKKDMPLCVVLSVG